MEPVLTLCTNIILLSGIGSRLFGHYIGVLLSDWHAGFVVTCRHGGGSTGLRYDLVSILLVYAHASVKDALFLDWRTGLSAVADGVGGVKDRSAGYGTTLSILPGL
jgi:hypothetical protein